MNVPEGYEKLAENEYMVIFRNKEWFYIKGMVEGITRVFLNKEEWNEFSKTVREADVKINGEEE